MKDFFLYKTELPMDSGFDTFESCHWFWIIGIGIFSWWMGRFFSFADKTMVIRVKRILGIVFPLMELVRTVVLLVQGHLFHMNIPCTCAICHCGLVLFISGQNVVLQELFMSCFVCLRQHLLWCFQDGCDIRFGTICIFIISFFMVWW